MNVWDAIDQARQERGDYSQLLKIPENGAASLTFANRGENEVGMQIIGGPPSRLVTGTMLEAALLQWEAAGQEDAVTMGESELLDLTAALPSELRARPDAQDAKVLVLRGFAQRLLGADAPDQIEHELEQQKRDGKIDSQALMRGKVKNKNARHNNCMADFEQAPDHAAGRGTVVRISDYPFIRGLAAQAAMWMQQDNPLICEQNRYYDVKTCGIGWHGDAEREIVLGYRAGTATKMMPMMFQAFYRDEPVGPKTSIHLNRGDVYIMSSKAVGTDWRQSSKVTWRHAAGNPATCSYVKDKETKEQKCERERLNTAIRKGKKVVRKSPFLK
jgi:hypothetical protein